MTLQKLDEALHRERHAKLLSRPAGGLFAALQELQGLKVTTVVGAAINTNIAVTGIATEDTLVAVLRLNRDATASNIDVSTVTTEASITSAGNIQLTTTNTTGDTLVVFWFDKR